ncbi:DCC1-like thiol-disulfide oxidoreductase family protein [Reichenbachiella sp.]|uniref:thiol-disulfide oxidoreductase DCC family protein n=1 Tax=Reichenbachiella sp. TaxID=2184521 RepID=UPI0032973419
MGPNSQINNLVLYDGVCRFCNSSVNFILNHERNQKLLFAPLQSDLGQSVLRQFELPKDYTNSLLFLSDEKLYSHSNAAFKIVSFLKMPWQIVLILRFLPTSITDYFYNLIARHRYKLMGKTEACEIPAPENKGRFLE